MRLYTEGYLRQWWPHKSRPARAPLQKRSIIQAYGPTHPIEAHPRRRRQPRDAPVCCQYPTIGALPSRPGRERQAALALLQRVTPDLIVSDINMPRMGGVEL